MTYLVIDVYRKRDGVEKYTQETKTCFCSFVFCLEHFGLSFLLY